MISKSFAMAVVVVLAAACSSPGNPDLGPPALPPHTQRAVLDFLDEGSTLAFDPATISYLKVRETSDHQCLALEGLDANGGSFAGILALSQRPDGLWVIDGASWGSGPTSPDLGIDEPRAHLAGGWNDNFCLGSWIYDPSAAVATVRLVSGDSLLAEDTVDNGVVVLVGVLPQGSTPMVELYDIAGNLLARHSP